MCVIIATTITSLFSGVRNLRKVQIPVKDKENCEQVLKTTRLGDAFTLHESFLCAGGEAGRDTCNGDGGGPLVCPIANTDRYVQVGVVSWGIGCGTEKIPGVYTAVPKFRNWIKAELENALL